MFRAAHVLQWLLQWASNLQGRCLAVFPTRHAVINRLRKWAGNQFEVMISFYCTLYICPLLWSYYLYGFSYLCLVACAPLFHGGDRRLLIILRVLTRNALYGSLVQQTTRNTSLPFVHTARRSYRWISLWVWRTGLFAMKIQTNSVI